MEMQQIKYFMALAETLNFTRAAELSNVTQPALTRAIKNLETELGGPLFHREGANTHMSELGRMMHPYFDSIQMSAQEARESATAFGRLEKGRLRIGVLCTIGPALISSFLMRFFRAFPEVELDVVDLSAGELSERLSNGDLELALYVAPGEMDERFHGLPLFDERFVLVATADHRLSEFSVVPGKELHNEAYVRRTNCEFFDAVEMQFQNQGIETRKVFSSERDDWVFGMIKAGMGFGYFPELSVVDRELEIRPLVEPEFVRTTQLVTVRGRPHSPSVGAFVRMARSENWRGNALN